MLFSEIKYTFANAHVYISKIDKTLKYSSALIINKPTIAIMHMLHEAPTTRENVMDGKGRGKGRNGGKT